MRQYGGAGALCLHSLPPDVTFKEVVIIGNGPSGISTSHLLAGHWPYLAEDEPWNRHPIIDQMFVTRLSTADTRKSLMVQDLLELADGLEGRSVNPVPLLMDNLLNPCADLGLDLPAMVYWKFKPERQIDHVVLGRGRPGGAWHCFDARVLTLSPARWLRLAGGSGTVASSGDTPLARARVSDVASYYENYIVEMGLQRFFRNNTFVTSVRPVRCFGHPSDCPGTNCPTRALWCVCGYDSSLQTCFRYLCTRVILATGASDRPNTLEAAPASNASNGHSDDYSAIYSLPVLELEIDRLVSEADGDLEDIPPVLVVGSGLTAADAVVAARASGLRAAHAYRHSNHVPPLTSLPQAVYPDYHEVYQMMRDGLTHSHSLYTALPDHILIQITTCDDGPTFGKSSKAKLVKLLNTKTNEVTEITVSLCAILIGSKPDLSFLPEGFEDRYVTLSFEGDSIKLTDNPLKHTGQMTETCDRCSFLSGYDGELSNNRKVVERSRCPFARHSFLKTQWHNLKTMVGHGLQGYKMRRKENTPTETNVDFRYDVAKINEPSDLEIHKCRCGTAANGLGAKFPNNGTNKLTQVISEIVDADSLYESNASSTYLNSPMARSRSRSPDRHCDGLGFGTDATKAIDCRSNPVDVDKTTHEVRNAPKGLYALGPLTGDNFVRFIPGGALAIIANVWSERKDDLDEDT